MTLPCQSWHTCTFKGLWSWLHKCPCAVFGSPCNWLWLLNSDDTDDNNRLVYLVMVSKSCQYQINNVGNSNRWILPVCVFSNNIWYSTNFSMTRYHMYEGVTNKWTAKWIFISKRDYNAEKSDCLILPEKLVFHQRQAKILWVWSKKCPERVSTL